MAKNQSPSDMDVESDEASNDEDVSIAEGVKIEARYANVRRTLEDYIERKQLERELRSLDDDFFND